MYSLAILACPTLERYLHSFYLPSYSISSSLIRQKERSYLSNVRQEKIAKEYMSFLEAKNAPTIGVRARKYLGLAKATTKATNLLTVSMVANPQSILPHVLLICLSARFGIATGLFYQIILKHSVKLCLLGITQRNIVTYICYMPFLSITAYT